MPEYYVDRASYDAAYRAKRNKRRKLILICVVAFAIILDVLIYLFCGEELTTIINLGGELLVVDKLMFVIAAGVAELALGYVGFMNEEKRVSFIVWDCFIIIIMAVTFFKNL
ncbi:MAG: hypothetical protein IKE62_00200 [Oscillospiraceae bacterium]|nr:hypothetical protein [Oscillospiraceae bacterium]